MKERKQERWVVWKICWSQLKLHCITGKTLLIALLILFYIRGIETPLADFSMAVGEPVTPWTFSVLMNDDVFPFVLTILYIIWVCDAPFMTQIHLYIVSRSGKIRWAAGEIMFLGIGTFIYTGFCYLCSLLCVLPHLGFESRWGKVLGTLAFTNASLEFPMPFIIQASVLNRFGYMEALGYTLLFMWGTLFVLGLLIFLLNWLTKNITGTVIAFGLAALDITITNMLSDRWRSISPISMMRISTATGGYSISIQYIVLFALSMIGVMILTITGAARRKKGV